MMEHHCPLTRNTWNWELPKFMMKRLRPTETKASQVFGLSVHVTHRRTGYPLPPVITDALRHIETVCVDQVRAIDKQSESKSLQVQYIIIIIDCLELMIYYILYLAESSFSIQILRHFIYLIINV